MKIIPKLLTVLLAAGLAGSVTVPSFSQTSAPAPAKPVGTKGIRLFVSGHSFHVWVGPILTEMAKNAGIVDHTLVGVSSIGARRSCGTGTSPMRSSV